MSLLKRPIILIGFMGAGKTSVAQALAQNYQCRFVDLDEHIASSENMSIPEIFNQYGEDTFRALEHQYLQQVIDEYEIVSTGGGIISSDETFEFLKTVNADIIWLDAPFSVLYTRIKDDQNRPKAKNTPKGTLKNLYSSRVSRYNEIAFMKVSTNSTFNETIATIEKNISANDQY
ncbi:shikimate kinase [Staphylococcus sp. IVB6227]|uniref:shikimate kinase n=1 Tax=Staphylococcus sp. IVB6227 TaxID=2989768 RepID=UPI0021CE4839|nr:shikimate kinase [Staphylococcus sp. IVB6227]UXR79312.1 shikimate kinase [Staphylococcus sp. IVB6227]